MIISVFKTSLDEKDLVNVCIALNSFEGMTNWNTDLEDCDNILRIESHAFISYEIIRLFNELGIYCKELED